MRNGLIGAAILGAVVFQLWTDREIRYDPGMIAPETPVQRDVRNTEPIARDGYLLTPLATFEVEARVLSAKRYRWGREADLSPVDLALGWGRMSDQHILDKIKVSQSGRFYFWRADELPIPINEISSHSANMHLIPATDDIARALKKVRKGSIVSFEGYLVKIEATDGWHWRSSLTRADTGNGACEVVYVERFSVL
jgi:hypothetical protein